jgi:hypothetical protein
MDADYAQRRRVAIAIAITAIAGPAAFLLNRGPQPDQAVAPTPAPGVTSGGRPTTEPAAAGSLSPLGTPPVGYLSGSTVPSNSEPAQIAIPRLQESVRGDASFSSTIAATTECHADYTKGIPFNSTLTITNLDNSRKVQCVASIAGAAPEVLVVLAIDTFSQIADLTDVPVPVEITWVGP